jgi:U6 snRNA-associated Sm-like protein LSm1
MTDYAAYGISHNATASLVEDLDKKLLVVLRDGRNFVGILRSFDQFANMVLQNTVERIFVGNQYCEKPLGLFIIRGDNVLLFGQIDPEKEATAKASTWKQVSEEEIRKAQQQERTQKEAQTRLKRKRLFDRGLSIDSRLSNFDDLSGY